MFQSPKKQRRAERFSQRICDEFGQFPRSGEGGPGKELEDWVAWAHQFGEKEEQLQAYQDESGIEVPALRDRPQPAPITSEVLTAYRFLSATRTGNGYGPNPISLSEIRAYLDVSGPPALPVDVFMEFLIRMDQRYLKLEADRQKRESGRKT